MYTRDYFTVCIYRLCYTEHYFVSPQAVAKSLCHVARFRAVGLIRGGKKVSIWECSTLRTWY